MLVRLGMFKVMLLVAVILSSLLNAQADAILTSWFTNNSGVLSRVIQSGTLTNPVTTWPSAGVANGNTGGAAQALPAYSDVQRIRYTATDLYINANGLASYTMGPWFTSGGGLFGLNEDGLPPAATDNEIGSREEVIPLAAHEHDDEGTTRRSVWTRMDFHSLASSKGHTHQLQLLSTTT